MTAVSLITLRETLEASLLVGIVLACLRRSGEGQYTVLVWLGVFAGVVMSLMLAGLFALLSGGFHGRTQALYQGGAMLFAAVLIAWMVVWMFRQSAAIRANLEQKVKLHLANEHPLGILFLVFVSTAREGVETVIFLQAALMHAEGEGHVLAALLGIAVAVLLSYVLFAGMLRLPLRLFFLVTGAVLCLFAADLAIDGMHTIGNILFAAV